MLTQRTSVGLDVHARSVFAYGLDSETGEVFKKRLLPQPEQVAGWIAELPQPAAAAYEAGPTGYGLARYLNEHDIWCRVAAPSKLQRPPGQRKNDETDAFQLARLVRLGDICEVRIPTVEQEAARDLARSRDAARKDLQRVRQRLTKLLLRHGIVYDGGRAWTGVHERWLRAQRSELGLSGAQSAFDAYYEQVEFFTTCRDRLDTQIVEFSAGSVYAPVMRRLCCLRGVATLTAFGLAVEIGDWTRFSGASIGAYVGLVPGEVQSGESRSLGPITKAGNSYARRLLVEAAWHHAKPYRPSKALRARWEHVPAAVRAHAHKGNQRLAHRWAGFHERNKPSTIAAAAVARELAGWCWAMATQY